MIVKELYLSNAETVQSSKIKKLEDQLANQIVTAEQKEEAIINLSTQVGKW